MLGKTHPSPPDYDRSPLREVTGNLLRPGDLALTLHGLDLCAFPAGAALLDLGCGPGASLALLKERGFACLGLDRSRALLREARVHAPCLLADAASIPLADACLDGIVCECLLSLAADKHALLRECRRVLRPGGPMLLSDLVARRKEHPVASFPEASAPAPCAGGAVSEEELHRLLRENGFTVLRHEDHTRLVAELAARIVWRFGSIAAFAALWHTGDAARSARQACGPSGGQEQSASLRSGGAFGYTLIIAENTGDLP